MIQYFYKAVFNHTLHTQAVSSLRGCVYLGG